MLFGENLASDVLLATLGLTRADVGRFRDVHIADGKIAIYTRNGGGNREHYDYSDDDVEEGEKCDCTGCTITYKIPQHPNYLYDKDDDFDCTYATVYYSYPEEYAEGLKALESQVEWDPDQRWKDMLEKIKTMKVSA